MHTLEVIGALAAFVVVCAWGTFMRTGRKPWRGFKKYPRPGVRALDTARIAEDAERKRDATRDLDG